MGVVHEEVRKKQSFETTLTDTMAGFREFQCQSLQQLRPNLIDQEDYDDFDVAVKIFESMRLPNDTKFYWVCINEFRENTFWLKYFIDRAENTFEENVQFLQALTRFTRDDQYMGKRLSSGKPFGSQSSSGIQSGSPSSGGNNSWGQTTNGQWGQQQRAPQWGTPPASHQWVHHQLLNKWLHHQVLTNGVLHQILRNGLPQRILNNGVHHQWLHNGVQHQLLNN